jgi:glutamate 5-kinase
MSEQLDRLVIKGGSSALTNESGMDAVIVDHLSEGISRLANRYKIIIVASGSIATGGALWGEGYEEVDDQTLATMGNTFAYYPWHKSLATRNIRTGFVETTNHEIDDAHEGGVLRNTLHKNMSFGLISVVNGNDAMSRQGAHDLDRGIDNDYLAAHVAELIGAVQLCFMTEVEGLLDNNGLIVQTVGPTNIDRARRLAGKPGPMGRGGMRSKVEMAYEAAAKGTHAHIAHANADLESVIAEQVGTHFPLH